MSVLWVVCTYTICSYVCAVGGLSLCSGLYTERLYTPSAVVPVLWVFCVHTISSCVCAVGDSSLCSGGIHTICGCVCAVGSSSLCSGLYMHNLQLCLCCCLSLCSNLYSERLYTPSAVYELILLFIWGGGGIKLL